MNVTFRQVRLGASRLFLMTILLFLVSCGPAKEPHNAPTTVSDTGKPDHKQQELTNAKALLDKAVNSAQNVDTLTLSQEALDILVRNEAPSEDLEVAYQVVGASHLKADHFDEAVTNFEEAVKLAPQGRKSAVEGALKFAKSWQKHPAEARRLKAGDRCLAEAMNKFEAGKFDTTILYCEEASQHYVVASEHFELAISRMLRSEVLRCAAKRFSEPDYYMDDYTNLLDRETKYHDMAENMPELYTAFQAIPEVDHRECSELLRRCYTMLFP